jgi:hypothetical protein
MGGNTMQTFRLMMREKPGGMVTGALFMLVRKLVSMGREPQVFPVVSGHGVCTP